MSLVLLQLTLKPGFLFRCEPPCVFGAVRQCGEEDDAECRRRQSLQKEKPLPSGESKFSVQAHEPAGKNAHHNCADWESDIEPAHRTRPHLGGEPERKVI